MGRSLNSEDVSGIYTCSCGNLETHVSGKPKAPCSSSLCKKNDSWTLIIGTEELENCLRYPATYSDEAKALLDTMKARFKSK